MLAEILLLRQQKEREAGVAKCQSEALVINIWTRFLTTLKEVICNFDNNPADVEGRKQSLGYLKIIFTEIVLLISKSLKRRKEITVELISLQGVFISRKNP